MIQRLKEAGRAKPLGSQLVEERVKGERFPEINQNATPFSPGVVLFN